MNARIEKIKQWIANHKIALIFLLFFGLVFLQHQYLWLYQDDYGYASLSYAYNVTSVIGHKFSLLQLFDFLIGHYKCWGGRVLYFFIECSSLRIGLPFFRLLQSLFITGIFYFIYKIIIKIVKKEDWKIALASCLCYGMIEIMTFRDGIFWISASVLYLLPLLPLFAFIYFYTFNRKQTVFYNIMVSLLVFLASFSQEQIGTMTISYIILLTIFEYYQSRKVDCQNLMMVFASLIGFAILMLAPGNIARMNDVSSAGFYNLSFLEKIVRNMPYIISTNFGIYTRIFCIFFFSSVCYVCLKNIKYKEGIAFFNYLAMISNFGILAITLYKEIGYFDFLTYLNNSKIWHYFILGIMCLQLLLVLYSLTLYIYKKSYSLLLLFYASIISQGVMLMAPSFGFRAVLPFEFVIFLFELLVYSDIILEMQNNKKKLPITEGILCIVASIITYGYYQNNKYHAENDKILRKVSEDIEKGTVTYSKIKLHKVKNSLYTGEMPYFEAYSYIKSWIYQYYNIPNTIEITYE